MVTKNIRINPAILFLHTDNISLYANFLFLKYQYANSEIKNYSINSLSIKTGKSRTFIRSTVSYALKYNLASFKGRNLLFHNRNQQEATKMDRYDKIRLKSFSPQSIKKELQRIFLLKKWSQCKYAFNLKSIVQKKFNKGLSTKEYMRSVKRHKQKLSEASRDGVVEQELKVSYYSLARHFNCSRTTAFRIIENQISSGELLKVNSKETVFENVDVAFFHAFIEQLREQGEKWWIYMFSCGKILKQKVNTYFPKSFKKKRRSKKKLKAFIERGQMLHRIAKHKEKIKS